MTTQSGSHAVGAMGAAFLAAFVEFIEALTVVLAVGAVRGWRSALSGAASALAVLVIAAGFFGPALAGLDLAWVRLVVGMLVLLFGLRWLRKSILRAAGAIPLHDELQAYARSRQHFSNGTAAEGWDWPGFGGAFQVVMLEGAEVAFIVIAVGGGGGALMPASLGAAIALACVVLLGLWLHRPIARIPENTLKCGVGILLTAFGAFWTGEAIGAHWPGGDWALPMLALAWAGLSLGLIRLATR